MKRNHTLLLAAMLLLAACAKEGFPSGGPKDEKPPVVLNAIPQNGSSNFTDKEFLINFDEYVTVRDAENNILISPPMKHKPEFGTKGRGILVRIKDTLMPNTTYLFQFKEGIADFNEGNVLPSYEYVFSTGSSIDSMSIHGQVQDAFSQKPSTDPITVVAYSAQQVVDFDSLRRAADTLQRQSSYADSIVSLQQPMYMTRCDKEGRFQLNHLRQGQYLLLALNDGDKNLRLNTGEAMAFLDTLVTAQHMPAAPDTATTDTAILSDSTLSATDSILNSTPSPNAVYPPITPVTLNLSLAKTERQRVAKSEFKAKGHIEIVTMCPLSSQYTLRYLDSTVAAPLYIAPNAKNDTLLIWTPNRNCDSISLVLSDTNFTDTLRLHFHSNPQAKDNKPIPGAKPASMRNIVSATHPYYDTLHVAFLYPVDSLVVSDTFPQPVTILSLADSTTSHCSLQLAANCTHSASTRASILFQGKPGQKYQITIPEGCVRDVYGRLNADALTINTELTKVENYGNIHVQVTLPDSATTFIVQLINEKGDALSQQTVVHSAKLSFLHLKGGKYSLRAISDTNNDGQWTPGDYYLHRQPEQVYYYAKNLELRENWDISEKWQIQ